MGGSLREISIRRGPNQAGHVSPGAAKPQETSPLESERNHKHHNPPEPETTRERPTRRLPMKKVRPTRTTRQTARATTENGHRQIKFNVRTFYSHKKIQFVTTNWSRNCFSRRLPFGQTRPNSATLLPTDGCLWSSRSGIDLWPKFPAQTGSKSNLPRVPDHRAGMPTELVKPVLVFSHEFMV